MQTELNYGVAAERGPAVMGAQEEKTWSVLAHLSIFLNLFTGFLRPVAALVIWLVYRDRSQKVAFHAIQSACDIRWRGWCCWASAGPSPAF